jgi:serine/threonine protein kinase
VGKAKYMAPEIYSGQAYDGRKIDIWCLGMMLFVLLFGVYPYQQASSKHCRYFREIENGRLLPMLESWGLAKLASAEALDLINRMLSVVPEHRISGQEILMHPWLAGGVPSSGAGAASVAVEDEVMR